MAESDSPASRRRVDPDGPTRGDSAFLSTGGDEPVTSAAHTGVGSVSDAAHRYKVLEVLGEGGFGTVYLAEDSVLRQRVAIKVLHLGNTDERTKQRFIFEAQTAANLRHSGIVNVFDIVQTNDGLQQVMEYYPGGTLKDLVEREGALSPRRALEITLNILNALGFAHKKGIIHRDIKPANIFFAEDGAIKIGDFGLCASFESHDHTLTGETMGTPLYMAPEQMKDAKDVDPRADLYSVGLTLYFMLTGERPVVVDLSMAPAALRPMISRATAQNRDRRLGSCEEFRTMINEVLPLVADEPAAGTVPIFEPEDIFESALLNVVAPPSDASGSRTRETSAFSETGKSLSIAAGAAVLAVFLTLGIVGGYLTLTSRGGQSTPTSAPPVANAPETGNPSFSPQVGADTVSTGLPAASTAVVPVAGTDGAAAAPRGDEPSLFPAASPTAASNPRPQQTLPLQDQSGGDFQTQVSGLTSPRPGPGARSGGGGGPPRLGTVEMADLPFFFPRPALRPVGDAFRHLIRWIEVDKGADTSNSLMTAARMLQQGKQVDARNPVYPYLMGRISEELDDASSARAFYAEVQRMAPILMQTPEESMKKLVELAGVEVNSPEAQAFLFGRPAADYR